MVTSDTRFLSLVRDFMQRAVRRSPKLNGEENKIILAVDEAVTNIIEHGYNGSRNGNIELEVQVNEAQFRIVIRDGGQVFDPSKAADLDIRDHVQAGKRRGLGIFLMRQIMDEVFYRYQDGVKNELTLVKYMGMSV